MYKKTDFHADYSILMPFIQIHTHLLKSLRLLMTLVVHKSLKFSIRIIESFLIWYSLERHVGKICYT